MNGFLVLARCAIDDLPLRLFADRKDAEEFSRTLDEDGISKLAGEFFALDTSVIHCVSVVEFKDGKPGHFYTVKDFEENE